MHGEWRVGILSNSKALRHIPNMLEDLVSILNTSDHTVIISDLQTAPYVGPTSALQNNIIIALMWRIMFHFVIWRTCQLFDSLLSLLFVKSAYQGLSPVYVNYLKSKIIKIISPLSLSFSVWALSVLVNLNGNNCNVLHHKFSEMCCNK